MSWSVTVNDVDGYEELSLDLQEYFASQHPGYVRDAMAALALAKAVGLRSATLSGGRTPNPYGGDEIADISIRGTPIYKDFLLEMREIIASGPGPESDMARHFSALAQLRQRPCAHIFGELPDGIKQCQGCGVFLNGTMLYFGEE
jgi:hypothetical protein